eukprot:868565-Alexandrium_andersonii.AAC.1
MASAAHKCPGTPRALAQRTSNPSCSRAQLAIKRHAAWSDAHAQCCSCLAETALSAAWRSARALH